MELISNAKTQYLLDASLESLHAESREWLNEITFWNEEMSFFYKLIHMREPHINFPTEALAEVEKELIRITSDSLYQLKVSLEKHERSLGVIARKFLPDEERAYRDEHRKLVHAMFDLAAQVKRLKQKVYSFI